MPENPTPTWPATPPSLLPLPLVLAPSDHDKFPGKQPRNLFPLNASERQQPLPSAAQQPDGCADAMAMADNFLMLQGAQCSVRFIQ